MYKQNTLDDIKRVLRATLTNQLARFFPAFYVKLTSQTGRGGGEESTEEVADYFKQSFLDYFDQLGVSYGEIPAFMQDKVVLEYGPGDIPGVGVLCYAFGAKKVYCVDRFPLVSLSNKNLEILKKIIERLDSPQRVRAESLFNQPALPESGLKSHAIEYLVRPNGVSGLYDEVDLIISRAVLEHVNNLPATFMDMKNALTKNGIAIHLVDLKSHGLHISNQLDFLSWPSWLWKIMYSHKGVPNRWRVNYYRDVIADAGLNSILLKPTLLADEEELKQVRPHLAPIFKKISDEDLSWLGFWLIVNKSS